MPEKKYDLNINIPVSTDELTKALKDLKEMEKIRDSLEKQVDLVSAEDVKQLGEIAKQTENVTLAIKEQSKFVTQLQKAREKLLFAQSEEGKQLEEIRQQTNLVNKENRAAAKANLVQLSSYEKLSKQLNKNKKRVKDLLTENRKLTKADKQLIKETRDLDKRLKEVDSTVGDNQRNVGNYSDALGGLTKNALKAAGAFLSLKAAQEGIQGSLESNEEGSKALNNVTARLSAGFNVLKNSVAESTLSLFDAVKQAVTGKGNFITFMASVQGIGSAFDNFGERVSKSTEAAADAADAQFEFERASLATRERLEEINGQLAVQQAIAGDTTRSFREQEDAANRVTKLQIERALIITDLAQQELDIIDEQIEARGEEANNIELLRQRTEKVIELQQAQNELDVARIENEKVLREVQRDRFERELDFAIDAFDAQKTVNERLVADDRKTLEERQAILQQTIRLADKSFQQQIQLVEGFTNQQLSLQELVLEQDEQIIRQRLRQAKLDDVTLGRILEIIRERKLVTQDIADLERDISEARLQSLMNIQDSEQNIEQDNFEFKKELLEKELDSEETTSQRKLNILDELIDTEKTRLIDQAEFEKMQAEQTIVDEEEKAAKIKEIDAKLKNDLVRAERELAEDREKIQQDELNKLLEQTTNITDQISDALAKRSDEEIERIDDEIAAREKALDRQIDRAQRGLTNEVEIQQRKAAELELEREKAQRKEERRQKVLSYYNLLAGYAQQDPNTALQKAAKDIAISETITLAFAEEGGIAGQVSDTTTLSDGKLSKSHRSGDVLAVLSPKEGILSEGEMNKLGGEEGFNQLRQAIDQDILFPPVPVFKPNDNKELVSEIKELKKIIKERPVSHTRIDNVGDVINRTIEDGITHTKKILSRKPSFRR